MNEDTTTNFISHRIRGIFRSGKQRLLYSRQAELESAYKTIRMAENYGDSYKAIADRIRTESARYKAFKQNRQTITRITINIKRLDSNEFSQHQYEIRQPLERQDNEGKASLSYTHERSCNTVLEFVLHDQNYLPLFAIARTYGDWIGYKEFDLGYDRVFYLEMVEDKNPRYVVVHAGLKTKRALQSDFDHRRQVRWCNRFFFSRCNFRKVITFLLAEFRCMPEVLRQLRGQYLRACASNDQY